MQGRKTEGQGEDYVVYARRGPGHTTRMLYGVNPTDLEAALSTWFRVLGWEPSDTRIVRVESQTAVNYFPSSRVRDRWLRVIARRVGLQADELIDVLAEARAAATRAYRARVGDKEGRRYMLHDFDGPLPVQTDSITGELTCLHPALTSDARDLFQVVGEARLDIPGNSLVLEFDGEIEGGAADGWQCVTLLDPLLVPHSVPTAGWFVVK